ncbi:MAG: flagellar basal body rod protein FlgB [Dehalococcoidia bacterium]
MLMRLLDGPALRTAQTALSGLTQRQSAIAANIANIDTPGYQRADVTFEETLRTQVAGGSGPASLQRTHEQHLGPDGTPGEAAGGLIDGGAGTPRDLVSSRNDGNTVGIDEEMTRLVETQLRYQALSQSLGTRLGTLRSVIRGQ